MSGVTSGTGLFSGINTNQLIDQLLAIDARPKAISQRRIAQIQQQQGAYLDINTRLAAFRTAAAAFGTGNTFASATSSSSNADVLTASASAGAAPGSYRFLVDRLVTTQQVASAGVADAGAAAGLTSLTFAPAAARLDRDTQLSQLNGGLGVTRGRVQVTDAAGATATVDLSRATSVSEVLAAFNGASGIKVNASVDGDRLVLKSTGPGGGALTVAEVNGGTTAASLGLLGSAVGTLNGTQLNRVGTATTLGSLNDGLGVQINSAGGTSNADFRIKTRDGRTFNINLGDVFAPISSEPGAALVKVESAVTDIAGVIRRIKEQTKSDLEPDGAVVATTSPDGLGLRLVDLTAPDGSSVFTVENLEGRRTATDLGIEGTGAGNAINGRRLLAGLNSTLTRNLAGGQGFVGGGIKATLSTGQLLTFSLTASDSVSGLLSQLEAGLGNGSTARLDDSGTRIIVTDGSGGPGAFSLEGSAADALGLTATATGTSITSAAQSRQYVGLATRLESLNGGRGVGTGRLEITNALGVRRTVNIGTSVATVGDLITQINGQSEGVNARINDTGDGILLEEKIAPGGVAGGQKISVRDVSGTVAKGLNLAGTATATGSANKLDGRFTRTVSFAVTDSLNQVAQKINDAGVGVSAAVLSDSGSSGRPFRLSLTARSSGLAGGFSLDSAGQGLGFSKLADGQDARVFYGSDDPATALVLGSSTNALAGVVPNLTLNLRGVSAQPVTVSVSRDSEAVSKGVQGFVEAFNQIISRIDAQTAYDADTQRRQPLLGDSLASSLRAELFATLTGPPTGVSGRFQSLSQVGITVGAKGELKLDNNKLNAALSEDSAAVADLFAAKVQASTSTTQAVTGADGSTIPGVTVRVGSTGAFASQGIAEKLASLADRYLRPVTGTLTQRTKTLDDQVTSLNSRIAGIDRQLASKRTTLQSRFTAMEAAIAKLQSQSGSLSNIRAVSVGS